MSKKQVVRGGAVIALILLLGLGVLFALVPRVGYCFGAALSQTGDWLFVAAGYKGLHTFRITPEGSLRYVSTIYDGGYYRYVEALDGMVLVANSEQGLMVYDVSRGSPELVWSQTDSLAYGIHIQDSLAYVAAERHGLHIFDISNPYEPRLLGSATTSGRAWDVWANGGYAYVADLENGLITFDVTDPSEPRIVGTITWDPEFASAEIIDGEGEYVFIASGEHGLHVIGVSISGDPEIVYHYDPGLDSFGEGVKVMGDVLYVSVGDRAHPEENGLHVFDILDPSSPELIGKFPVTDWVEDVAGAENRLALTNRWSGVLLFNVGQPGSPELMDTYPEEIWRMLTKYVGW